MANSKLARSLRVKLQLRDKKGRWIEMGRGGKWFSSLDGSMKSGIVIGSKGNKAIIREKNADGSLGSQNVEVPMNTLEMIPSKASLDPNTLQLMNEYKEGQSAKGKKESDAREQALSDAMAAEGSNQPTPDEVEVEYEVSAQEELEDLLDNAPEGAILTSDNDSLKKAADGSWQNEMMERSSGEIASTADTDGYVYASEDEHAKKINELFDEIENGPSTAEDTDIPEQSAVLETPAEPEALIDISAWKYHQGTQGGSNPGGIYTDTEGNDHYVKKSKSDMHAKNEVMADKFYEKLGIKTSQLKLADVGNGKLGTSSKMVPGSKNDFYNKYKSDPAYLKKFQEDFAADAWLANWDVVGLEYDNVLSDANGDAIRIDPGGALLYRAMGSPKGDMFGPEVGEWESMRNGNNPASNVFGSMSDEDLKNSVAKLKNITDDDIAEIVDSMEFEQDVSDYLKNTLSARRQNLLNKFPELANEEQGIAETPLEDTVDAPSAEAVPEVDTQTAKPEPFDTNTDAPSAESELPDESEVAPTVPAADNVTPAGNDMGEEIPVINGAKAMLSQMAKKQGISVDQLQKDLGLPADGAFPNKGKTVTNDNGDVFEANSIVSNPKFGEGIASIILPSTNSVKVLYADHGFKVTQAKNLNLVSGTAPEEVASQALDLSGANPGDVGTNAANGKMYFVDKNGNAKYVGDEVEYTKKGVTQHGKVASIYKGTKTAKIEWDDDTASVKKASQLVGKDDSSDTVNTPETQTPEAVSESDESIDTTTEDSSEPSAAAAVETETEETPEPVEDTSTAEEAPEAAPEASDSESAPATPAPVEEPVAETPVAAEDKGWTPAEGYDPMGPTKIQIFPNMEKAIVYPHDNSALKKEEYNLTNKVGYNPIEEKYFGTGHNLQPLYEGDKVSYLFNGAKYSGEIIEVKPKAQSAVVLLDDGTKKLKKFSQLSGNHAKTVDVDENGNYTDWNGNAAQIPNFKGAAEDVTPEEVIPEAPQKVEWGSIVNSVVGQSLDVGGETYYRIGGNYQGDWFNPKNGAILNAAKMFNIYNDSDEATLSDIPTNNLSAQELNDLGVHAKISSNKLGLGFTKDSDGDWYSQPVGYVQSNNIGNKIKTDDWVIDHTGDAAPAISANELEQKGGGQVLTIGDNTYFKFGDDEMWWSKEDFTSYSTDDITQIMSDDPEASVRLGEQLSSNLSYGDLSDLNTGAEIYSEKLHVTLEKDGDGDWTADGLGYFSDDVMESIVSDDWVIQSKGNIEPNYSSYDLSSANVHSTLYSEALNESFTKNPEDDWISDNNGNSYSSEHLLEEFPTDDWSLSESEIDGEYNYGMGESEFDILKPGSKISYTESAHDTPDDFIKIDDNIWVILDKAGKPQVTGVKFGDNEFEDGYTWIYHEEQGEYELPKLLNIEPNAPSISNTDISLEWLEAAPSGTAFKSSMSDKWTYIKNDEGLWATTDPFGETTGAKGTSEQIVNASQYKYDLVDVYVPQSEEDSETNVADFPVGTFIPTQEGSEDTGFTKVGENEWKMKSGGQEVDHVLNDDFIAAYQKATNSTPVVPATAEDSNDSGPLPDIIKPSTPEVAPATDSTDSEPLPDIVKPSVDTTVVPEAADPNSLPSISGMKPAEFDALPVGSKLFNTSSGYTYEKVGNIDWISYKESEDNGVEANFTSDMFHGILSLPSVASDFKILGGSGGETNTPENATPEFPEYTSMMTSEEFSNLPIGTVLSPSWDSDSTYTKTDENNWFSASGTMLVDDQFLMYVDNTNGDALKVSLPTPEAPTTESKSLFETSKDEILNAPVGSTVKNLLDNVVMTKDTDGLWKSSDPDAAHESGAGVAWIAGKNLGKNYMFTPATGGSSKPQYPTSLDGFESTEDFDKLPIGSTMGSITDPDIYTKTGINEWTTKAGTKKTDQTFHYIITTNTGGPYKIAVPEDGVPIQPVSKLLTGMSIQELKDAPKGSTITYVGTESYNLGVVMTKTEDGEAGVWENNQQGTASDSSDDLILFTDNPTIGSNWEFQPADTTTPEPEVEKSLKDITDSELEALPNGTKLTYATTTLTKQPDGSWVSGTGTNFDSVTISGLKADEGSSQYWMISGPDETSEPVVGTLKSVKISQQVADGYPVGTVVKREVPTYYSQASDQYYVKLEDGTWQHYKQTAKTLSAKQAYTSSMFNNWTHYTVSVSIPKSGDHFISNSGELGFVGDYVEHDGGTYQVSKIMKTGVKLTDGNSNSITVKPQKLNIASSNEFGWKGNQNTNQSSTISSPSEPVDLGYDINASDDFAGASADEYNEQGLTMGHVENPKILPAFTLTPSHEPDITNPLYGKPQPKEPAKPNAYPAFVPPKLELPKWSSEAWLAKVEQRYLDNPNKAKSSLQESNKWTAVQSVLNGEKNNLDSLLSSKYLDEDLYNEAVNGIDSQVQKNKPLIEEHDAAVSAAQAKYDADKTEHLASYTELKTAYDAELLAWMSANPDPDAMKLLNKPAVSTENFTGGTADWSKSHIGTHTAESVFSSIKMDNDLGRHGLSIATDADKVEGLDVNVTKTLSPSGDEVLDLRFKVTQAHGKVMSAWAKKLTGVKKSNTIYPPNMKVDQKTGLLKDTTLPGQGKSSGERFEITHEDTGARIIFQRDTSDKAFNNDTNHNSVRVVMPLEATPEQYKEVLDFIGIEGKPASEGDIRVLAENKIIGLMGEGLDAIGAGNLKGEERKKALESIKSEYGVSPEDVVFQADVNGRVRLFFNDKATKKLASKLSDIKSFSHNLSSGSDVDTMMNILTGAHPGLLSTYHRWSNGMSQSGMSSVQDMKYGSGDYIYTTPTPSHYVSGNNVAIHPEAVIRKLDAWANYSDSYGKKTSDGYDMGAYKKLLKHGSGLHEYLPTGSVSINDMHYISVYSGIRADLIKRLKAKGILKINGFNIEDFIISQGMTPQEADYIPGIGVVPAGTTWDPTLGVPPAGDLGGEAAGVGGPAI